MIAVLHVKLPFDLLVPEGEQYTLCTYEDDGYLVQVGVPLRSDASRSEDEPEGILLNGKKSFYADTLKITFGSESFNREIGAEIDPPYPLINKAIGSYLTRLKYAAKTFQVQLVELPEAAWKLTYLNDDGSELEKQEGFVTGRGALALEFSWIACDSALWDIVHSLPPDFSPPEWRTLLTDAYGALPHVGAAIVLTATSLEVFISAILDGLQSRSSFPEQVWSWINGRSNRQNNPTVEEQYSELLAAFCGKSLKSDIELWQKFKNLKTARNNFVHEGEASVGGAPVTAAQASEYIAIAEQITSQIREWIPDDMRWPVFEHNIQIRFVKRISSTPEQEEPEGAA